jgi:hypothetical protein
VPDAGRVRYDRGDEEARREMEKHRETNIRKTLDELWSDLGGREPKPAGGGGGGGGDKATRE